MEVFIDAFCMGFGAIASYFGSKVVRSKLKRKDQAIYTKEEGIYGFEPHESWHCPKCGMSWQTATGHVYCECEEYHTGHFHKSCDGNRDKKTSGCKYKWIMRTK